MSDKPTFFSELKRRNVYKVAVAYAVVSWLIIQIATQVFPFFEIPNWAVRLVVILLILGFPIALVLSWAFEITPEGIKRESEVSPNQSITAHTGRKLIVLTVVMAVLAAGLFAWQIFRPRATRTVEGGAPATPAQNGTALTSTTGASIADKSIAVLPFENLSDDKSNAYFADGVQDEILTDLARVADLKVISRTSVMQYRNAAARNLREIGQQLGVAHLLEGSVQRASGKVRINAQLIDARSDAHLWAQTYDRDLADVFVIQSEIARTIADQLQAKLSPKEQAIVEAKPTRDMVAYDLYLQAAEIDRTRASSIGNGGVEGAKREVELLNQAITRDPAFVPALCKLANTYIYLHWLNDRTGPHVELARKALEAAARLQPDGGEVHLSRALLYYRGSLDYEPALAELALAQRGLPNDASIPFLTAMIERRQGKWEESIRHAEQAIALDPRAIPFISELATTYLILRRYDEGAKTLDSALRWKPLDFGMGLLRGIIDLLWAADPARWRSVLTGEAAKTAEASDLNSARLGLALFERKYREAGEVLAAPRLAEFDDNGFFFPREWGEGIVVRGLGDVARANAQFLRARERAATAAKEQPDDARVLMVLGQIDAALGRKEDAIREGERAMALLPVAKDAVAGGLLVDRLARIYAQAADPARALNFLESAAKIPNGPSYGSLKLEQDWDALRSDARFEKIIASLAPKDSN